MELCLQLMVIFVGKQFFLAVIEYYLPVFWQIFNVLTLKEWKEKDQVSEDSAPQYVKDFKLTTWSDQQLFYEYLEMVIQYGFITIFVTAFPLAPLFALLNNFLEIRFDAKKVHELHRRPVAQKVKDIGVWYEIMETLGRLAVISNAFIIALTSEFIPKMVYKTLYSEDNSLKGYANFSLSYFNTSDFDPLASVNTSEGGHPEFCRYPAHRNPPWENNKYEVSSVFYVIWGARLAFVVIFQDLVVFTTMALRWIIPDMPRGLSDKIRREAYITNEIIIRTERYRAQGLIGSQGRNQMKIATDDQVSDDETETTTFSNEPSTKMSQIDNLAEFDIQDL